MVIAVVLFKPTGSRSVPADQPGDANSGVERDIAITLTDFNICQSIFRD
jgi:hypothetical protein